MSRSREFVPFTKRREDSEAAIRARINACQEILYEQEVQKLKSPDLNWLQVLRGSLRVADRAPAHKKDYSPKRSWAEVTGIGVSSGLVAYYPLPMDPNAYVNTRSYGQGYFMSAAADYFIRAEFSKCPPALRQVSAGIIGAVGELFLEQPMIMRQGLVLDPENVVPGMLGVATFMGVNLLSIMSRFNESRAFRKATGGELFSEGFSILKKKSGVQMKLGNGNRRHRSYEY